ncbi:uncharacterized protein LOC110107837 [Dendrobium catenatum]|uniref:uncharacterized protein LOC110107837 n=1 Tax=Dendrobium catenatum TaxID=906689 RepID=UPI0009F6286B|nr:uncharacterized protein LOC110107837 [Dendrobium catenatum]
MPYRFRTLSLNPLTLFFVDEASCHNFDLNSSRRIWVKWNASKLCFKPTMISSQLISGTIWVANQPILQLSVIYASNSSLERKVLWDSIAQSSPANQFPWALIGDFNCCRFTSEKLGGSPITLSALTDFNNMIFSNGLKDLNSVGLKYTWFNQRSDNPIHIKLDRVLVNEGWLNAFADSCITGFLLKIIGLSLTTIGVIFWRFFLNLVMAILLSHFCKSLKLLKGCIKKEVCSSSSIKRHLDALMKKQVDLLGKLQDDHNNLALNLSCKDVKAELVNFNSIHTSWTIQRAKVNWLKNGEDDIKFLFAKIRTRRGGNKSVANLLASNPSSSTSDVISAITDYFQDLYNPVPPTFLRLEFFPVGSRLPDSFVYSCTSPVMDDEIKKVVFMGSSNSAPGSNGFNFYFYKTAWHIIGPSVCRAIRSFFQKYYMPNGVKATALAIIPKNKNATLISDHRPTALCNSLNKIIAKVIAQRLKPIMNSIVMDNQAGFVKSRVSTDNILLASEILAYVGKNKRGKFFCAKLDVKKAFDSISKEFLLARLLQKGFPNLFVNWIKACISDVNFSIVLNGALEGYFSSFAGLRQGCPLSPYLFYLVMDAFSNILEGRGFKGISLGQYSINHLLYADDVLIFGEASIDNCNLLAKILSDFANASVLHINYDKSFIMFPKHLNNFSDLCQALSIHNMVSKISYLGVPLSFYKLRIEDFMPLMDSVNKKMNGWKANLLSFAGRLQYIKFTIQNTIAYWIRGSILTKAVYKYVKKTSSRFLFFGDSQVSKKLHMISWDKICRPKCKGDLSIPSIFALQFAYNCSVIYRMYNLPSPLSTWLTYRYRSPWSPPPTFASKLWHSICETVVGVKSCFKFIITHNAPISLRWDHWCNNITLAEFSGVNLVEGILDCSLNEFLVSSHWVFPDDFPLFFRNICEKFSVSNEAGTNFFGLKEISLNTQFVWLALMGELKMADALQIRNIIVPDLFSFCFFHKENVTHLFFECPYSSIISALIPGLKCFLLRPNIMQILEWVKSEFKGFLILGVTGYLLGFFVSQALLLLAFILPILLLCSFEMLVQDVFLLILGMMVNLGLAGGRFCCFLWQIYGGSCYAVMDVSFFSVPSQWNLVTSGSWTWEPLFLFCLQVLALSWDSIWERSLAAGIFHMFDFILCGAGNLVAGCYVPPIALLLTVWGGFISSSLGLMFHMFSVLFLSF